MRKINLLHIIGSLPEGGAENIIYTLAKNIDKSRFNLIICCLDDERERAVARKIKEEELADVYCLGEIRVRGASIRIPFTSLFRQMVDLFRLIRKERIDIVHTHLYKAEDITAKNYPDSKKNIQLLLEHQQVNL